MLKFAIAPAVLPIAPAIAPADLLMAPAARPIADEPQALRAFPNFTEAYPVVAPVAAPDAKPAASAARVREGEAPRYAEMVAARIAPPAPPKSAE